MSEGIDKCIHLQQFMECQIEIMRDNIDGHKWFNGIPNENEAYADFIKKYGWLIREMYCGKICQNSSDCNIYKEMMKKKKKG